MFNLFRKEKVFEGDIIVETTNYNEYTWMCTEIGLALCKSYAKTVIDMHTSKEFIVKGGETTAKIGFKTTEKALKNLNKKYVVGYSIIVR